MAVIDTAAGVVVVRIAYDGDARAGKTTNLHALSRSLSRTVFTPPQPGERTLYFDWLEYTGGLFEGMQVRCEVVSVPGQEMLSARRELLVHSADVVVHVVDMSVASLPRIEARIQELRGQAGVGRAVPCGILVQANKCDLPHPVPLAALRDLCERQVPAVGMREAVAQAGTGIRETFVFAVRLALDRVRELKRLGDLGERAAEAGGGEALLRWLQANEGTVAQRADLHELPARVTLSAEDTTTDVDALGALRQVLAENDDRLVTAGTDHDDEHEVVNEQPDDVDESDLSTPPALPDPTVPSGMIWPPIEGRVLLEEVTNTGIDLQRTSAGAWLATVGERWRLHSGRDAEFPTLESARRELLQSARAHTALGRLLSHPRAIVVANTGRGTWRLWQIVRIRPCLRDTLASALGVQDPREVADCFSRVGTLLVELNSRRGEFPHLPPCTLDTVGPGDPHVEFVGLLSSLALVHETSLNIPGNDELVRREFLPVVRDWASDAAALLQPLDEQRSTSRNPTTQLVAATLHAMLSN